MIHAVHEFRIDIINGRILLQSLLEAAERNSLSAIKIDYISVRDKSMRVHRIVDHTG